MSSYELESQFGCLTVKSETVFSMNEMEAELPTQQAGWVVSAPLGAKLLSSTQVLVEARGYRLYYIRKRVHRDFKFAMNSDDFGPLIRMIRIFSMLVGLN